MAGKRTPNERPAPTRGPSRTTAYRTDTSHLRATSIDQSRTAKHDDKGRLIVEPNLANGGGASY